MRHIRYQMKNVRQHVLYHSVYFYHQLPKFQNRQDTPLIIREDTHPHPKLRVIWSEIVARAQPRHYRRVSDFKLRAGIGWRPRRSYGNAQVFYRSPADSCSPGSLVKKYRRFYFFLGKLQKMGIRSDRRCYIDYIYHCCCHHPICDVFSEVFL